jgi:translation initiation factor IF-3
LQENKPKPTGGTGAPTNTGAPGQRPPYQGGAPGSRPPYQGRPGFQPKKNEPQHNINEMITAREVRLTGEGIEQGVYSLKDALRIAEEQEMDLVEIVPNATPPVCRVIDYKKFLYEQKKKLKEIKSNQKQVVVKEIRFGPNTDEHDFKFKLNHAVKFLEEGAKVRAYVFFKGRSIVYKEQGEILLLKFAQELEQHAKVEQLPKLDGKKMILLLAPKKK